MNSTHSLWCLITGFYRNEMYKDVHCVTGIYIYILLLILQLKLDIQARQAEDKLHSTGGTSPAGKDGTSSMTIPVLRCVLVILLATCLHNLHAYCSQLKALVSSAITFNK